MIYICIVRLSFFVTDRPLDDDEGEGMGLLQELSLEPDLFEDIQNALRGARLYLSQFDFTSRQFRKLKEVCSNNHELCALWSVKGECQKNPLFMNLTCAPMCHACKYLLQEVRCPLDPNEVNAWSPGDLNRMFERIVTDPIFRKYKPKVWLRPITVPIKALQGVSVPNESAPWIVTLERLVSPKEVNHLLELFKKEDWQDTPIKSQEVDDEPGGTSVGHCVSQACLQDNTLQTLIRRLQELTNIASENFEHVQLLRYREGHFLPTHSDYVTHHIQEQPGVRIFSILLYLNNVEEGGGTNFPRLNLTVAPKPGRALIFPSVLNEDPNHLDNRTDHQALPVMKGVKYGT